MFFYQCICPHCQGKCMTTAVMVKPWVECQCGKLIQVPANAKLVLQSEEHVEMYQIIRYVSRN